MGILFRLGGGGDSGSSSSDGGMIIEVDFQGQ